ncbi:MAG TPA: hypothetical protein PKC97_16345 [Burkholderiaceae bacterium]|jgi:hypothetical protein|nr:hypothetical protein [Burkholderiaceae bacterium]
MKLWTQRRRRQIAWLCAAIALWMPWEVQLHGLWHARHGVSEAASLAAASPAAKHDAALVHATQVCEQCLLLGVLATALPSRGLDFVAVGATPTASPTVVRQHDVAPFRAYRSRAPPRQA